MRTNLHSRGSESLGAQQNTESAQLRLAANLCGRRVKRGTRQQPQSLAQQYANPR